MSKALPDRCVAALVPQAAIDAAVAAAAHPIHDDGHTDCYYAGILLEARSHLLAPVEAERDRLAGEVERLREAVATHANEIDSAVLNGGVPAGKDRDAIDNRMYNAVRALDPTWWDEKVPGLNAMFSPASDEKGNDA